MQLKQNISILVHKLMHFISAIISGGLSAMLAQLLSSFSPCEYKEFDILRQSHFRVTFLMLINFYFYHFVLRALISMLNGLLQCLITENYCSLQSKMRKKGQRRPKILSTGAENSSFCEQFPTLSDFRCLQNFLFQSFKEELFSLSGSFCRHQW